jgi:hypothetical protein
VPQWPLPSAAQDFIGDQRLRGTSPMHHPREMLATQLRAS